MAEQVRLERKRYSPFEVVRHVALAVRSAPYLSRATKRGLLSPPMRERLMLAVTEVNRCPMCSYAHTQKALEAGMSTQEIEGLLAGQMEGAPAEELPALLFAQHYADSRGRPSAAAWKDLEGRYGRDKAAAVLAAVRSIMMGNAMGIPLGALRGRLRGTPDPRCSLGYELCVLLCVLVALPFLLLLALEAFLFRTRPQIR